MKVIKRTSTFYEFEGGYRYPRVTTVLDSAPKPHLDRWKVNKEREYVVNAATTLNDKLAGEQLGTGTYKALLDDALSKEKAHEKELRKAGNIGTEAHAWIEWDLRHSLGEEVAEYGPEMSEPARIAVRSWMDWKRSRHLKPVAIEQTVYSHTLKVAGTLDLASKFKLGPGYDWMFGIHDWKTSGNIWPTQLMQVAVYRACYIEMGYIDENTMGVVVRLSKDGEPAFEVAYVTPEECDELVRWFKSLRGVWEFFINRGGKTEPPQPASFREAWEHEEAKVDPFSGLVKLWKERPR